MFALMKAPVVVAFPSLAVRSPAAKASSFAMIVFALVASVGFVGCKDEKAKLAAVGPAGAKADGEAPVFEKQVAIEALKRTATVEKIGTDLVITAKAKATAPLNAQPEERKRVATETARMLAMRSLLAEVEATSGQKIPGDKIPALLKRVEVVLLNDATDAVEITLQLKVPLSEAGAASEPAASDKEKK